MANVDNTTARDLRLYYDSHGLTLTVWFDDPAKEYVSEETGEGVVLNKDEHGTVIGFEKLHVSFPDLASRESFPVEVVNAE